MTGTNASRACWCGHLTLETYSNDYSVCRSCGTLVSRALPSPSLYGDAYWTERQTAHHHLPDIRERARLDLPERCTHWLARLLSIRLPPGRILEVGCGHGGYLALLAWAGFDAIGTDLSPGAVKFAREAFAVAALEGPVSDLDLAPASFDVVVLNDVLEHLPSPLDTLASCVRLLSPGGCFIIQTPEYVEHRTYEDLRAANDLFLKHMDRNNEEHLYLFSRRSAALLFSRVGFPHLEFSNPVYSYDMYFVAGRTPIRPQSEAAASDSLMKSPSGRLVLALLDKARESTDRWWAIQRLKGPST